MGETGAGEGISRRVAHFCNNGRRSLAKIAEREKALGPFSAYIPMRTWCGHSTWLPASGRSICGEVMFEAYLNNPRDVPPGELLTEIFPPLEPVELPETPGGGGGRAV